ncbi:putative tape measure protein [Xanthomonas virus PB119]|nr:putative tape measure protein [Xanthomonas virus PB119]
MRNIAELSDEEFLNQVPTLAEELATAVEETTELTPEQQQEATDAAAAQAEADRVAQEEAAAAEAAAKASPTQDGEQTPEGGTVAATDKATGTVEQPADGTTPVKGEGAEGDANPDAAGSASTTQVGEGVQTTESAPDYKGDFEKIMAPFVANGRKIELKSPEEAKQLMQMGANYTRKMQELAPHRRALAMLQNNQLTDEASLSFLIDLKKGDKGAITKLLKDSGIDPRDIDIDSESTYQGGNHRVSDQQVDFQSTVDDLKSMDRGQETIAEALKWDQASIDAVGNDPSILRTLHDQRVSGVYDLVATEVNRRKTLGVIPANTPFLMAYRDVGNEMAQEEARAKAAAAQAVPAKPAPVAVATTVAQVKSAGSDKAKAAAASRSTPAKADVTPTNVLAMADDDFLAKFAGRV